MVFPFSRWRLSALMTLLVLASLGAGCHKKSNDSADAGQINVYGKVTYKRVPLLTNSTTGLPTGLEGDEAKFTTSPARGVSVRVYQYLDVTSYDGTTEHAWVYQTGTYTLSDGSYTISVAAGYKTMVELLSTATFYSPSGDFAGQVNLFAQPDFVDDQGVQHHGADDPTLESNRVFYALRKGLDGSVQTDPKVLPGSIGTSDVTVNFDIGLNDPWWITPKKVTWTDTLLANATNIYKEGSNSSANQNPNISGSGSRVLAILDSCFSFSDVYGIDGAGTYLLDLNYYNNGNSSQPAPVTSNIDFDMVSYPDRIPQAFDGSNYHYFGTVQGGTQADDAFDEGVLFPLMAKLTLLASGWITQDPIHRHPVGDPEYLQDLQDLAPDLAMFEGLSDAMSAPLLKSPYLGDTTGVPGGGLNAQNPIRDIRNTAGFEKNVFSAPGITALAWEVILKSNSLASPGTPADWAKIAPLVTARFFYPSSSIEVPNIYHQLTRLQEAQASTDPVDLQTIFTDAVLTPLLAPYNIPWPRPTTTTAPTSPYRNFTPVWDENPNSFLRPLPPLVLSMAKARLDKDGKFPNVSWAVDDAMHPTTVKGEVYTAIVSLTQDAVYDLSLNTSPAIPATATVAVTLATPSTGGVPIFSSGKTYLFGASSPTQHYRITLGMAGISSTTAAFVPIQIQLLSPDVRQPSDLTVTLNMVPTH